MAAPINLSPVQLSEKTTLVLLGIGAVVVVVVALPAAANAWASQAVAVGAVDLIGTVIP